MFHRLSTPSEITACLIPAFNSSYYLGCGLGIGVVVYDACLNSGSLFLPLFTKQVWDSQRHGEVKPFPPLICSRVKEL